MENEFIDKLQKNIQNKEKEIKTYENIYNKTLKYYKLMVDKLIHK